MRKSYDTAFKVKVAPGAAKEQRTLQELWVRLEVSPGQVPVFNSEKQHLKAR